MKTIVRSIALSLCAVAGASLLPDAAFARGGGPSFAGRGGHGHGHGYGGGHWGYHGHRGYVRPGVFWGGVGLGLGVGAIGYYGGAWAPYGYAPYPVYERYDYGAVPSVIVAPGVATLVDPAARVGQAVPQAARAPDPIFYPNQGQSAATAESDRRDCNRWATTQNGAMADAAIFQRATLACMEGRGYTVK